MNDDVDGFFAEQDRHMSIPDEDIDEYIQMRIEAVREKQYPIRPLSSTEDISAFRSRNDGPQCESSRQSTSLGAVQSPSRTNPQIKQERDNVEMGGEPRSLSLDPLPGPSSTTCNSSLDHASLPQRHVTATSTPVPARCAKRPKITGKYSNPNHIDRAFHANLCDGSIPDCNTSRTTTRGSGASIQLFSGTGVPQRVILGTSGPNSMSTSTNPAPESDSNQKMPIERASMVQTTDMAMPNTEDVSGYSTDPTSFQPGVVQGLMQYPNTPPIFIPNATVEVLPPALVSPHRNAASSTMFDGHGRKSSEFTENPPHPYGTATEVMFTSGAHPTIPASSSHKLNDGSHEASNIEDDPVPRTTAGFHTLANPDISCITSPGDVPSRQLHRTNVDSHLLPAGQPSSSNMFVPKEPKARKTVSAGRTRKTDNSYGNGSKKVKAKLITPLEYAQKLQSCLDLHIKPKTNYLKGKRIFYIGGDMMYASTTTRKRMEYIVKHGGTLVPKYDPAIVTHIVTDAGVRPTLRALSLKSLSDIPNNIPTVTWDWVVSGYGRAKKRKSVDDNGKNEEASIDDEDANKSLDFEFMHAAFSERIDAGCNWKSLPRLKQGRKATSELSLKADAINNSSGDISHISTFSQGSGPGQSEGRGVSLTVLPPLPLDFGPIEGRKPDGNALLEDGRRTLENEDPLAEYYAQARAEREAKWNDDASDSDNEDDDDGHYRPPEPRRGFTCDVKWHKPTACANQHVVDKLEELRDLHKAKPSEEDRWRAYSYGKCIPALRNYPKPIKSFSEARSIRGVGEKTALKIMEIVNTGELQRIKYENTDEVTATRIFQGIYGVGRHTAFTWFTSGLRTLDDVRARKGGLKLTTAQEIGLQFYGDVNTRMPREEARKIFEMIKRIALAINNKLFIEIMGSYRRGKADCGDIDVLITRPTSDGKTHQGVLRTLLEQLHAAGIVTEDLAVPDDFSDLELVYRGLCKLPELGAKRRRIDFLCVPWESRGAALLYYTGDEIFNRAMRLKANKHGYSLNQRGLYAGVVRDPKDRHKKVWQGRIIASETEEEIFTILGVPWQEPHERVRGS